MGKIVVLANGCWDPPHFGHLLHLKAAREMGDRLIVSVTSDASVAKEKGAGRPSMRDFERAAFLKEWRVVDEAFISNSGVEALESVRTDILVKGLDYVGKIDLEIERFCKRNEIQIRFTNTPKWSATNLLHELRRREEAQ